MLLRRMKIPVIRSSDLSTCYDFLSVALPTGPQVSGSGRQRAARPNPLCPDCGCENVTVIARSLYAADQLLSSKRNVLSIRSVICWDPLAFATPIAATSYKSFPLISLSVISVRDGFNEITNDPLYLCPVLLNFNYAEVVNTKI